MIHRWAWWQTPSIGRDLWLLSAAVALVYLATGNHPAFSSSTRYPEACREMVELGEWIVPHLGYVPYFEKPILTYWLGAAAQWAFGTSPLAVNLPAALAALISVWATYGLAVRLRGSAFGLVAGLALLACAYFFPFASTLTTDPILAGCLAIAWLAWWRWEETARSTAWIWGFWLALALGFMSKGLVALALPGAAIAGYALLTHGWRGVLVTLWQMHPLRGLAIITAVNLPWTFLVWQRDPRFLEYFYIRYNLGAFVSSAVNHPEPWWYYLPQIPGIVAPYTLLGLPALASAGIHVWQQRSANPDLRRFLLCIVVFPLIFLSLSQSKLGTYPLPMLPAFIVLIVDKWWQWDEQGLGQQRPWWSWALAGQGAAIGIVVTAALVGWQIGVPTPESWEVERLAPAGRPWVILGFATLVGGMFASAWLGWRQRLLAAYAAIGATLLLVAALIIPRVPLLAPDFNLAQLAEVMAQHAGANDVVLLHQEAVHSYEVPFVVRRRFAILDGARETGMGHIAEVTPPTQPLPEDTYSASGETYPANAWLWSFAKLCGAWSKPQRLWIMCERPYFDRLTAAGLTVHVIGFARDTYVLSNQP